MSEQGINNPLIELLERAINRIKVGDIQGITIAYQTKEGKNRVICSEGDIEIPESLHNEMSGMAAKILNKVN